MAKELKLWNGRPYCIKDGYKRGYMQHLYICAYSRADANRLINEYNGYERSFATELRDYFSEGSWGNRMKDITPERGLWIEVGERPYMDSNEIKRLI